MLDEARSSRYRQTRGETDALTARMDPRPP